MSQPEYIRVNGALYTLVKKADKNDPAFQPLLQDFQNESAALMKLAKEAVAAVQNAGKAVMGEDYQMGYSHMSTAAGRLDNAQKKATAAADALNTLVGIAGMGAKPPAKAASTKKR